MNNLNKIYELNDGEGSSVIYKLRSSRDMEPLWCELEGITQSTFFHSWSWIGNWVDLILPLTGIYLYCFYYKGSIKAACCLTKCSVKRKKGFIRVQQLQMNEYLQKHCNMVNGYNGLLVAPGFERQSWSGLLQAVEKFDKNWDEFVISALPEKDADTCLSANTAFNSVIDKTCYEWKKPLVLSIGDEVQAVESFKRKSRQQLRQTLSAFSSLGESKVEFAKTKEEAQEFFNLMGGLHTQRWQKVEKKGSFGNPVWVNFHTQLIAKCFDQGVVQLSRVIAGSQVVGYLYGHVYKGTVYMHQTGFLQLDDNRLRSGCLSHHMVIQRNAQQGITTYDFLPDFDNSYKKFFVDKGSRVMWIHLRRKKWKFIAEQWIEKIKLRWQKPVVSE